MPRINMKWLAALTLSALPFSATAQVENTAPTHSFRFEQGGYEGGAVLSGVLTGRDLDGDGLINSIGGELDSYSLSFKAGTLGRDIDTGLVTGIFTMTQMLVTIDIQGVSIFKADQGGFFFGGTDLFVGTAKGDIFHVPSGGIRTLLGQATYLDDSRLSLLTFEPMVLTATAVPEPATTAMGAVGLLAVAALARRRYRVTGQNAA